MLIRHLEYFVALERTQHFARAAVACNVSQPTLSAGIATLEEQLGTRLIERDRRYVGLTAAGRAAIPWAQQILAANAGMAAAAGSGKGPLTGTMRLGAIPASMPVIGPFAASLRQAHPMVELSIRSLTSREIVEDLAAFRLDAGITYIDHEPPVGVTITPLYAERPLVVVSDDHPLADRPQIDFAELLDQPLCLLHGGMQNRRILDEHLAARGLSAGAYATADSYVSLLAIARGGAFAVVMPDSYRALLPGWARVVTIASPYSSRIGLIVPDRTPRSPLAEAAEDVAAALDLPSDFGSL